jgi:small GTP-binding protein
MSKVEDKIADLEERLKQTVPNKHTMNSIVYIKAQLAKLRSELVEINTRKSGGGGGFGVKKTGDSQVAFIGYPNVGKSSLLNNLTLGHTQSKVADYDFTTLSAIPGMMEIEGAKIQLIDLPGIILGASQGKGKGKEILGVVRTCDLILIIICFGPNGKLKINDLHIIREELYNVGIRLNQKAPHVDIKNREKGGIGITSSVKLTYLDDDMIKTIMHEYKIRNAAVYIFEDLTPDRFIDGVLKNRNYIEELVIVNKVDLADPEELKRLPELLKDADYELISALQKTRIPELRKRIFNKLNLIKIYLHPPGKEVDMENPLIIPIGSTLHSLCLKIHKEFLVNFRYAQVWGPSARHPGQKFLGLDHVLADGDIVMITLKR